VKVRLPQFDHSIFSHPIRFSGRVLQYLGRVLRRPAKQKAGCSIMSIYRWKPGQSRPGAATVYLRAEPGLLDPKLSDSYLDADLQSTPSSTCILYNHHCLYRKKAVLCMLVYNLLVLNNNSLYDVLIKPI